MSRQFKRAYDLTIIPDDGNVRIIKDLRIDFEVTKSIVSTPNIAKINITNPNQDTISALQKKYTKVVLNAGYEGSIGLIFRGEIRNVFQGRKSTDNVITIYAGDGQRDWNNATFNKTFSENVGISAVIKEVIKTFVGSSEGAIEGIPNTADKLRGQTLSGSSKDILDQFSDEYNFDWSIQDGEVVITPNDQPLQGDEAVLITSATGMLGSPTITELGADVTALLNPKLLPNKAFKIASVPADVQLGNLFFRQLKKTTAEGIYKIQEVIFKGDSRDGDWTSTLKGKTVNAE